MQKKWLLIVASVFALSAPVMAQQINRDSLSIVSKISGYQVKRADLMNKVEQTTRDKEDAAKEAQNSADKSSKDAARLSDDAQNRKLANSSQSSASDAQRDSKRARAANKKLEKLNEEIVSINGKIAKEQSKLDMYVRASQAGVPVLPAVSDTSRRM